MNVDEKLILIFSVYHDIRTDTSAPDVPLSGTSGAGNEKPRGETQGNKLEPVSIEEFR